MRLTGPLNLTLDGPPELGFYASRAHGGFLAFDVFEIMDGLWTRGCLPGGGMVDLGDRRGFCRVHPMITAFWNGAFHRTL